MEANILDNIGIKVNMRELPSFPLYEYASERLYGTHWLSRLWCRRLRPRLMPARQAEAERIMDDARRHMQMDFISAVLETGAADVGAGT